MTGRALMENIDRSDPFDLTGRMAIMTGGSRSLEKEMVKVFAGAGISDKIIW